jgi:carbonic anhydrase/acetyltransferase-like protein (isoleucine patch superfamily)
MIVSYRGSKPQIGENVFIAEGTVITGNFSIGAYSGLWYGVAARADVDKIYIGSHTNIQDGCLLHCSSGFPTVIGDYVTVGHGAILHGCRVADNCLIGMGSIIMDGAEIGEYSIIGAGALITPGKKIAPYSVVMGSPGKVIRRTSAQEESIIKQSALEYAELAREYLSN